MFKLLIESAGSPTAYGVPRLGAYARDGRPDGGRRLSRFCFLARLTDALRLVAAGMAIGGAAALLLSRSLSELLYDVEPRDASIFAAVPAVLLVVALSAAFLPARRATQVDPVVALRSD